MNKFQLKGKATTRVVYPSGLFEKRTVKGAEGEPKYNAVFLVPKSDTAKVEQIMSAFNDAFKELQAKGFKGKVPSAINPKQCALKDGDKYADENEGKEAFRGYYMLSCASRQFRPIVVDKEKLAIINGKPIPGMDAENISPETLEDGDYVHLNISFWTYHNATASGIGANVHAVMRIAPGERIAGASTNVDDYITDVENYE